MTEPQRDALNRIEQIMREHFTTGVIIVEGEITNRDDAADIETIYHGGYAASIGLLELGKLYVWRHGRDVAAGDER